MAVVKQESLVIVSVLRWQLQHVSLELARGRLGADHAQSSLETDDTWPGQVGAGKAEYLSASRGWISGVVSTSPLTGRILYPVLSPESTCIGPRDSHG